MNAQSNHLSVARQVLQQEEAGLAEVRAKIGEEFVRAVEIVLETSGKVVVSGVGKAGHISRKIAATLASTGTPAFFMHPSDAGHGDLGMLANNDVLLLISYSAASGELNTMVEYAGRLGLPLLVITGQPQAKLALAADVVICATVSAEACSLNLAPTSSTTAMLALGDALAVALLEARGFTAGDFARTHPDGKLGRQLTCIADLMHTDAAVPRVSPDATLATAIIEMSSKRIGATLVAAGSDRLVGIFTDGDLRRCLERSTDIHQLTVAEAMTSDPVTIHPDRLATDALALMERKQINHLPAIADGALRGVIDIHQLVHHRIV